MLLSLSDTGYLCDATVLVGLDPELDKGAVNSIRRLVFQPITLEGKPVPGTMVVRRDYWRGDTSNTLYAENADATPAEDVPTADLTTSTEIWTVISAGKVDGERYQNNFFGLDFTAHAAKVTAPDLIQHPGTAITLVDAISESSHVGQRYRLSIRADRLSNYPQMRTASQYLDGVDAAIRAQGGKTVKDSSPFVISGQHFTVTVLKEAVAEGVQYRGLFVTAMRGYILFLDVAAPTESQVLKLASSIHFSQAPPQTPRSKARH